MFTAPWQEGRIGTVLCECQPCRSGGKPDTGNARAGKSSVWGLSRTPGPSREESMTAKKTGAELLVRCPALPVSGSMKPAWLSAQLTPCELGSSKDLAQFSEVNLSLESPIVPC